MQLIEFLEEAVSSNNLKGVEDLVQRGVDVNERLEDGRTVLILASALGFLEVVKTLVKAGADANVISNYGEQALRQAAIHNHEAVFEYRG